MMVSSSGGNATHSITLSGGSLSVGDAISVIVPVDSTTINAQLTINAGAVVSAGSIALTAGLTGINAFEISGGASVTTTGAIAVLMGTTSSSPFTIANATVSATTLSSIVTGEPGGMSLSNAHVSTVDLICQGIGSPASTVLAITNHTTLSARSIACSGNLDLLASRLSLSGRATVDNIYNQNGGSTLELQIPQIEEHGRVSAELCSLDGALVVNLEDQTSLDSAVITLLHSHSELTSQFSSHTLIDAPDHLIAHLSYTEHDVLLTLAIAPTENLRAHTAQMYKFWTEDFLRTQRRISALHEKALDHFGAQEEELVAWNLWGTELAQEPALNRRETAVAERVATPWSPGSFYIGPIGSLGKVQPELGFAGGKMESAGAYSGVDYMWGDLHPSFYFGGGLSLTYEHMWSQASNHLTSSHENFVFGDIYGVCVPVRLPSLSFDGSVGYGYRWVQNTRHIQGVDGHHAALGATRGSSFQASLGAEYTLFEAQPHTDGESLRLLFPICNIQYARSALHKYHEHGAGIYNTDVGAFGWDNLFLFFGTKVRHGWALSQNARLLAEVGVGIQQQCLNGSTSALTQSFAPFPFTFKATVPAINRGTLLFEGDLQCRLGDRFRLELDYDFLYNSSFVDHSMTFLFSYLY
jgi:hypothetical protein